MIFLRLSLFAIIALTSLLFLTGIIKFSATAKTIKIAEISAAKKMVDYIFKNKLL